MSADGAAREAAAPDGPFVGLNFFTQENAAMFFGRDHERTVLISNLRAARLTLLYAQSGAGKSSLLRAGVASRLAELALRSLAQRGTARNIPVVFSSWRDDPTAELTGAIQEAITPFLRSAPAGPAPGRLAEAIDAASGATGSALLVILDQFEEYFLYRRREGRARPFADELAACINRADLRANFLIATREDAYSALGDLFKGRVSNVYGNYFHLEHLTRDAAREAIEKPVASFNERHPDRAPVQIEPSLVDTVLDQLRPDKFASAQGGTGRLAEGNGAEPRRDEVAAPYLQLVMKRLWDAELRKSSGELRLETLEELGGAQTIVRTHVDRALESLPDQDREAAVDILHHLVTPSGTKIALAASDLAEYTSRPADEAEALLQRLASSDTRILRPVPPPPGQTDGARFEISHDLLAPAILDWGRRHKAARLEHEKEAAQRQAHFQKRRARVFGALAVGSAALLVLTVVLAIVAVAAQHAAQKAAIARAATSQALHNVALTTAAALSQDPELSTLLALKVPAVAETVLRNALAQLQLEATLIPPAPLRSAVFSASGRQILTASADGTVRIWNSAGHTLLATFSGSGPLDDAAFSPDGTQIVTANEDGTASILDSRSGRVLAVLKPPGNRYAVSSVAFSPDGRLIAAAYADGTARIWNARTREQDGPALSAEQGHQLLGTAFSPDGRLLVTVGSSGNARIYDVQTRAQRAVLHSVSGLLGATFSADSKLVVTAGGDGTARIWSAGNGRQVAGLTPPGHQYADFSAVFSPGGNQVVTASGDGTARIWDVASGRLVRTLGTPGHDSVQEAAFSPDGTSIVTASAGGLARIWDASDGRPAALLPAAQGSSPLSAAALSPDGALAVTSSHFGTVTIWRAPAPDSGTSDWTQVNVISLPEGDAVNATAFSPDGKLLATAGQSGRVYVWQIQGGLLAGESDWAEGQPLNSVEFDPADADLVVTTGQDGDARIFKVSTGAQVGSSFGVPGSSMNAAAFSPDGKRVVTASRDGYARVWNAAGHQQIGGKFGYGSSMSSVEFSHDGKEILTTGDNGFTNVWDATQTTPTPVTIIEEPGTNVPYDAAFSPDDSVVVTGGTDGTAREWSARTGRQLLTLAGHSGSISTVAFSGTEILTASSDGSARIWDSEPIEQRGMLAGPPGREITGASFSPANPRLVATANGNGTVSVWNTGDQQGPVKVLPVPGAVSAQFSTDGKLLVTAGNERVEIWPADDLGHPATVFGTGSCPKPAGNAAALEGATFNASGSLVVTADADGSACVWNVSDGKLVQVFTEPAGLAGGGHPAIRWAVFSPRGKQVLTASNDGTARLWDVASGQQVQVFSEPTGDAINHAWFGPDGTQIVTASDDGTARIWSVATATVRQTLSGADGNPVYNAVFSRTGALLVACSGSAAEIWSAKTGQRLTQFQYGNAFSDCEFSPDGSQIITTGDGQARIFSTELAGGLAQITRIAEQRATQPLTASEQKEYQTDISQSP